VRIGVGRIVLDFYNNDKLATKHRALEELCAGLRKKFNVSALEIDEFDDMEKCVIGFAAVIPDTWTEQATRTFVQKICTTIDETSVARVMIEDWDILEH
jgi:uncharacterized protein YlxP (DUF503 family)